MLAPITMSLSPELHHLSPDEIHALAGVQFHELLDIVHVLVQVPREDPIGLELSCASVRRLNAHSSGCSWSSAVNLAKRAWSIEFKTRVHRSP